MGCEHDVGEEDIFGGQPHRAVCCGDQQDFDVEDVFDRTTTGRPRKAG
jgi:hypothetical protein